MEWDHGPLQDTGTNHPQVVRYPDQNDPDVKEAMRKAGTGTVKTTPAQYRAQIEQEVAQWKPLINEIAEKK
jgi:tripartite-type tricarboxylate transporter receptor subunit TctC